MRSDYINIQVDILFGDGQKQILYSPNFDAKPVSASYSYEALFKFEAKILSASLFTYTYINSIILKFNF